MKQAGLVPSEPCRVQCLSANSPFLFHAGTWQSVGTTASIVSTVLSPGRERTTWAPARACQLESGQELRAAHCRQKGDGVGASDTPTKVQWICLPEWRTPSWLSPSCVSESAELGGSSWQAAGLSSYTQASPEALFVELTCDKNIMTILRSPKRRMAVGHRPTDRANNSSNRTWLYLSPWSERSPLGPSWLCLSQGQTPMPVSLGTLLLLPYQHTVPEIRDWFLYQELPPPPLLPPPSSSSFTLHSTSIPHHHCSQLWEIILPLFASLL